MQTGKLQRVFGRNLKLHRTQLGLSQERFALEMGVHRTYMGGVERGEKNLTLKTVEVYCEFLNVDPLLMMSPHYEELLKKSGKPVMPQNIKKSAQGKKTARPRSTERNKGAKGPKEDRSQ